ncbi:MAG: glycosyltransferase family 2 protein [Alistipes sp.]|nr:glycosyltransferase family 2 protein [Alistipes sp.]
MKLLSIIIPTYNMESLLPQCLDSILQTPSLAAVEAVVVNDGSRDASLRIARDYESRNPDVIRVIDKPNGNYGSTINAALPVVRGEYVRILDADDCFDGGLLADYIAFLHRNAGTDMIVSPFIEVRRRSERRVGYDIYSRRLYDCDRRYDMERVLADGTIRFFMMHSVSYRTELLRGMNYRQSEGISYTDQEWVFYPLFKVATVAFADIPLYRYNLAREGQTMDAAVQLRSIAQLVQVTANMAAYFAAADKSGMSETRTAFLRETVRNRMRVVLRKYLLDMPDDAFAGAGFGKVYSRLRSLADDCGIGAIDVSVNNLLRADVLAPWLRRGRRYPSFVRLMLRSADSLMVFVHGALFRRK